MMIDDVVGSLLESLRLQSSIFSRMELGGQWGFSKPALEGAPFYLVISGQFRAEPPGSAESVEATAGDLVILPRGSEHVIRRSTSAKVVPFKPVIAQLGWAAWTPGMHYKTGVLRYGPSNTSLTVLIAGVFGFEDRRENPLLSELPVIFHLKRSELKKEPGSWFAPMTELLKDEVGSGEAGSGTVAARLADIIFVQAVRMYLRSNQQTTPGWLKGIADPQVGRALSLIHAQPEKAWTVAGLAQSVGMSRARFAARFRSLVGRGPLDYLTRWRMHEAAGKLSFGEMSLASLAAQSGYKSEIAFAKAFKRFVGYAPTEFRRRVTLGKGTGARLEDRISIGDTDALGKPQTIA